MRAKDITPGAVYAYQERDWYAPEPIVFLAPANKDNLFQDRDKRAAMAAGEPLYRRAAKNLTRPYRHHSYPSSRVGYMAVRLHADSDDARTKIDAAPLTKVTLDRALAATDTHVAVDGVRVDFTLVVDMAKVLGPYDEVIAAYRAKQEADQRAREEKLALVAANNARADAVIARLADLGVKVSKYPSAYKDTDVNLALRIEAGEELVRLLDGVPTDAGKDRS